MAKSKRANLTAWRVADLKATGAGQFFLHDLEVPGLSVRATKGSKSFVFERRFLGRTVRVTIGAVSAWRLPEAREEARRLQRLIDTGIDPRKDKADREAAKAQEGLLVSEVFKEYLKAHRAQWSERHMKDHLYLSKAPEGDKPGGVLWPLLEKQIKEIDAPALISWTKETIKIHKARLAEVEKAKAEAAAQKKSKKKKRQKVKTGKPRISNIQGRLSALRQGYIRFRAFWRWTCERQEYGELADPKMFSHSDLRSLLPADRAKNDVLEKSQLKAWFSAIQKIDNPVIAAYLQTLLLTGARRNELEKLQWTDIDFRWKKIQLHDKIDKDGRAIPLTPYVEHLLDRLPRRNEWVFSSPTSKKGAGRLVEPRIAHKRALSAASIPGDLSIHGLRRSFASLSEWVEMPVGIVAQIMGHKPSATAERHYKRRPLDLLALWHGKLEGWILNEAGIVFDPKAVKKGLQVV